MSLKDLFREKVAATNFSDKSLEAIGEETESAEYLKRFVEDRERFVPQVDYSRPENFAFFGSAEKYYEDSIKRIYQQYPYDGSKKEKISWHLTSSYFDNWFFDNEYPRTNGHALLSADGWGAVDQSLGGYGLPASVEYIQIKGGPNRDPNSSKLTKIYPSEGGTANVYDTSNNRESNLKFDLENNGVTIEFWLQKDAFPTTMFGLKTNKEVIFDLWNGQASSSADYGRLTLEISGTAASESPFYLTAQSGTAGFYNQQIGASIAGTGSLANWGHYAVSLANAASGVDVKFYVNGDLNQSTTLGSTTLGELTGSLIANIGALRASPSGSTFHGASMEGYGKLSGSIDEFRFWKTKRNSQEIGRYWFTQVGAGANTDTANTNLGVYYKFNEGITGRASTDSVVLDYSGRISNGTWTGYGSNSRSTQSAMVLANAASSEFKDPIIYSTHPLVSNLQRDKRLIGKEYDFNNNQSLVNSFPAWILDGDGDDGELRRLTQVMSSYFDTLYLQIKSISSLKDVNYVSSSVSGTWKPLPFAEKLLTSNGFVASDIFIDSEIIEQFLNRDEDREYESSVADVKNMIFQNVYNNLTYIYKSKGTEKSFRNLVRCFGVDDELIKLNLYADNVTYQLTDNYRETSYKNGYVDFNADTRFEATVHQFTNPSNDNTVSYLSGSGIAGLESGSAFTVEAEITFPKKRSTSDPSYFDTPFSKSCLFGMHTADTSLSDTDLAWASSDVANFQVFAVRNDTESKNAKFILTGSAGGYISELSSDIYRDTYDDERWVFAVRLKPVGHPMAGTVLGTSTKNYEINFYGGNATFGSVDQEFEVTGNITHDQAMQILSNPKRMFVGAHRQNFTGSVLNKTDVKVGSLRVWQDYIPNEALRAHIIDPHNMGTVHPSRRAYLFENNLGTLDARQIETLALEWTFETLTGSNASGQFTVPDVSSGSISDNRFGDLSNIINRQHSGRGFDFPVSSTSSIDKIYDFAYAQQLPEILTNQDTVKVLTRDDETFTREQRPINYFYSVEKSMYQEISGDMLKWFATIKDYNNLIGEPVNRYRQEYKDLSKLRQLFFERVRNTPDFEKFTTFYKWFDSSLNEMIFQLFPASANSSEEIRNLVESHILERNKYWNKFPTLESKQDDPEAELRGVNELLYDWKTGHAPVSNQQNQNCFWWNERAEREGIISSGDTNVDSDRGQILDATVSALNRRFGTPQKFSVVKSLNLHGGVNLPTNKKSEAIPATLQPETIETIDISLGSDIDCTDGQNTPTRYGKKIRIPMDATGLTGEEFITGDKIAPFTVFSSSAGNTTLEIETNKELTNLHVDGYGDLKEKPLQGPFTEKYVGGLAYRHQPLMKAVIDTPAVPARTAEENVANADYTTAPWASGDRREGGTCPGPSFEPIYVLTNQLDTSFTQQILIDGGFTQGQRFLNDASLESNSYIAFNFNEVGCSTTDAPQVITEAKWIFASASGAPSNQGTWKYQGSNDSTNGVNGSWTDIGGNVVLADAGDLTATGSYFQQVHTQLSANTTAYAWYRLVGVSGTTTNTVNLNIREVEFKVAFAAAAIPATYRLLNEAERAEGFRLKIEDYVGDQSRENANYNAALSTGDRTSDITRAQSPDGGAGDQVFANFAQSQRLVDGLFGASSAFYLFWDTTRADYPDNTDDQLIFGFPSGQIITEAKVYSVGGQRNASNGSWKWQGSNNAISWTDIGSSFTWQANTPDALDLGSGNSASIHVQDALSSNTVAYSYYRLLGVGGSKTTNCNFIEFEFKIATEDDRRVRVMQPEKNSAGTKDLNLPRARYYRDETAKRPLNIRNIHHTTGSTIIGNYDELYQVVQTSNRRTNNRWWVRNANGALGQSSVILSDGDSFLVGTDAASEFTAQAANYVKPQRGKNPSVFVERFAAPGGADSAGDADGGPGLDALSAEYSPYSTTNYRNNLARTALNEWSTEHCGPFGTDKDVSVRSEDYNTNASYHKTNRNPIKRIQESGSTIITASVYDNFFVQHPIPQSDLQYAWITASAISAPFGYAIDPRRMPNDEQMITFVSSSDYGIDLNRSSVDLPWTGTFANTRAIWALNREIPIDFVGMHYVVDDPVSASENTLGYSGFTAVPSTVVPSYFKQIDYINKTFSNENSLIFTSKVFTNLAAFGLIGDAAVLNAINLNRNGPYGYPSWKQTRTDQHAIARHQRSNNRLDYIKPAGPDETSILRIGDQRFSITVPRPQRKKTVIEPVVTSKYKPLRSNLNMDVGEDQPRDFAIKHTYGNNISYFTHEQLNDFLEWPMLGSGRGLAIENQPPQVYDDLYDLYMDTTTPDDSNPIKEFVSLRYSETVYPRASNAFLDRTRSRIYFDVASIIGWRNSRSDRAQTGVANSQGNSLPPYTSSMWPLDGRWDGTSFISASILAISSSNTSDANSILSGGIAGTGELLNDYVQFHNGNVNNVKAGALYARRDVSFMSRSSPDIIPSFPSAYDPPPNTVPRRIVGGDALWEAPAQAGKNPFYDSYDDFAEDIKRMGKDFSIVPEFNISDHVEYFLNQGDWFADLPNNVFSLDGAAISGTADRTTIENKTFFSLYNSSDFLKHFQVLNEDHTDEDFKKGLQLSCQSIMKFRPREGYYPAQRTVQLANIFSQSFADSVVLEGDQSNFRTFMAPFFAPGILFNTIKSGIAVDYPIMTSAFDTLTVSVRGGSSTNDWLLELPMAPSVSSGYSVYTEPWWKEIVYSNAALGFGGDAAQYGIISSSFHYRMPFESILNPSSYLSAEDIKLVDMEPHPSASLNSTASFAGGSQGQYELASHNFFAETAQYFLSRKAVGNFTSFVSTRNAGELNPIPGKTYKMDVILTDNVATGIDGANDTGIVGIPNGTTYTASIDMYRRAIDGVYGWPGAGKTTSNLGSAFGPPVHNDQIAIGTPDNVYIKSSAPFTPPYYDGPAKVTLEFTPRQDQEYNIEKIVQEVTASYIRPGTYNPATATDDHGSHAYQNAMQISSSVNLTSIIKNKLIEKDEAGRIVALRDANPNAGIKNSVWAIEPKFETPILDFRNAGVTLPVSGAFQVARGMWHQYGNVPDSPEKGIFLQVSDSSGDGIESLADLVGFEKTAKRLGEVAGEKTVAEAIIAIPIIRGNSTDPNKIQFVPLRTSEDNPNRGRQVVEGAKAAIRGENYAVDVVRQSDIDMVEGMQKFIIPPKWDFVNNPEQVRDPFTMFIFEFEHTFNQQDLVDMWQNLPPDETRIARNNIKTAVSSNSSIFAEVQKLGKNFGDLQWIVFKAKQRGSINYFEKTLASKDDDDFKIAIGENPEAVPKYGYNWPYDYFSLVELVKVDAEVKITKKPEGQTRREEQEEIIEIERTRRGEGT